MVNDATGTDRNAVMKKVIYNGQPHLCLFALRDVSEGEQLFYDYGQPNLPWRKQVKHLRVGMLP
ncbi:hypothetical protein HOLleu_40060 [Holothuria leucospilota]|uniref:SET domain-containing protein n=1 Tax=Holothuria leucospilota TaxID=206669 RepID=A0A9Q1BDC2_HOLLE|nr:hypothetical protein HOLleu_40060 [Holothuria leucospilota]